MASVTPVEATDLNGIQISPMDIVSDELIGYCSYVKNLCSDLGTKNDSPEGYKSFLDFQKQIQAAKISTFEPEAIQTTDNSQSLDLTGENAEISFIPVGRFMNMMNQMLWANMGVQFTPFSQQYQETNDKYLFNGQGLTPYDVTGNISAPTELGEVLTA